jgi:tRNA pseudouridine13 synthase
MNEKNFKLGGKIKTFPDDFIVEEVWKDRICQIKHSIRDSLNDKILIRMQRKKEYLHFTLVKRDWETIRAINCIRKKIRTSIKRFGISGMKDKRAYTAQRVSLWRGEWKKMFHLKLQDIKLKDFNYSNDRITLGNATGNQFTITIRDIPKSRDEILDILCRFNKLITNRGIPNYFGPQRFGGHNADIGAAIIDGELKKGTELILNKIKPFLKSGDLKRIPKVFWYEKRMLNYLKKYPRDYAGTLRKIPKRILRLYTHSYQSHIFNEKLKKFLIEGDPPISIIMPGFDVPKMPELKTFPIERKSFLITGDFKTIKVKDGLAILSFTLNRGEYASTLLANLLDI